jgi:hypothetical protein
MLVPFPRELEPKQELQRLENDREAGPEQARAEQRECCGKPEPVVEQPKRGVALAESLSRVSSPARITASGKREKAALTSGSQLRHDHRLYCFAI